MARCSICYTVLAEGEQVTTCTECHTDYHQSCWTEIGGCGSYGCKQAAVAQKPPLPVLVGAGWGDSKPCPACGHQIGASLLMCGCGARFPWADPISRDEYREIVERDRAIAGSRTALTWMFILSLFGLPAPVLGPLAGAYAYRKRTLLAGTGGTYLAMGYGAAALGGCYLLLIAIVALGG